MADMAEDTAETELNAAVDDDNHSDSDLTEGNSSSLSGTDTEEELHDDNEEDSTKAQPKRKRYGQYVRFPDPMSKIPKRTKTWLESNRPKIRMASKEQSHPIRDNTGAVDKWANKSLTAWPVKWCLDAYFRMRIKLSAWLKWQPSKSFSSSDSCCFSSSVG